MAPSSTQHRVSWRSCLALLSAVLPAVSAITVDINSPDSIIAATKTIVPNMVSYYQGDKPGGTPGVMPFPPYYWWEGAEFFSVLIDYWYYTGDDQYNNMTITGMQAQVGQYKNYEPADQDFDLGNDDQMFWAFAAMDAAEYGFPNPPPTDPQWLALAQAVFNRQTERWDPDTCNGGLRWQVFIGNKGYNYKNTIANAGLFQLASRLGAYTGNQTYFDWAVKMYNWIDNAKLIGPHYNVFDGIHVENCSSVTEYQFSYNLGTLLYGSAVMWNSTQDAIWKTRVQGFLTAMSVFFRQTAWGQTMWEAECEDVGRCTQDMQSYKNDLARWLGATTRVADWTKDTIVPLLQTSAIGASKACTGPGNACGLQWYKGSYDGTTGLGEEMDAAAIMLSNLVQSKHGPLNSKTGGNSTGNAGAGNEVTNIIPKLYHITTADKAGAGILTVIFLGGTIGTAIWMIL